MPAFLDRTGRRYGEWTVLHRVPREPGTGGGVRWVCQCDCGEVRVIQGGALTGGHSTSCGHLQQQTYKSVHSRPFRQRGSARGHACADCGKAAREWSYDHLDKDERSSPWGPFSEKPEHYIPRCASCHRLLDARRSR